MEKCMWCGGVHGKWEGPLPQKGDIVVPASKGALKAAYTVGDIRFFKVISVRKNTTNRFYPQRSDYIVLAEGDSGHEENPLDCLSRVKEEDLTRLVQIKSVNRLATVLSDNIKKIANRLKYKESFLKQTVSPVNISRHIKPITPIISQGPKEIPIGNKNIPFAKPGEKVIEIGKGIDPSKNVIKVVGGPDNIEHEDRIKYWDDFEIKKLTEEYNSIMNDPKSTNYLKQKITEALDSAIVRRARKQVKTVQSHMAGKLLSLSIKLASIGKYISAKKLYVLKSKIAGVDTSIPTLEGLFEGTELKSNKDAMMEAIDKYIDTYKEISKILSDFEIRYASLLERFQKSSNESHNNELVRLVREYDRKVTDKFNEISKKLK